MQATFRTFESGAGDCLFLVLKDENDGSSYHVMVDCYVLDDAIKSYILHDLGNRVDTLIITHIDIDHVSGITKLMQDKDFEELKIGQILFNAFQPQTKDYKPLDEETKKKLEDVAGLLPVMHDEAYHKTSGVDAGCFVSELRKHKEWKKVWRQKTILAGEIIKLGNNPKWGCLKFLSPSQEALDNLLYDVKMEYAAKIGDAPPSEDFEDQDKYYELMLRLAALRQRPYKTKKTGSSVITRQMIISAAQKDAEETHVTNANKASLAFCWESEDKGKRLLLMGDAVSSQVMPWLDKMGEGELHFEAVKISHHGSKNNTSIAFNNKIRTNHYFITGGKKGEGPHLEAISKYIMNPSKGEKDRELHINHTCGIPFWVDMQQKEVVDFLYEKHFKLKFENVYQFEY